MQLQVQLRKNERYNVFRNKQRTKKKPPRRIRTFKVGKKIRLMF